MATATTYAELAWTPADVQTLAPGLTTEQAEEWLDENQNHIRERLCELGWGVIEELLSFDNIALEGQD